MAASYRPVDAAGCVQNAMCQKDIDGLSSRLFVIQRAAPSSEHKNRRERSRIAETGTAEIHFLWAAISRPLIACMHGVRSALPTSARTREKSGHRFCRRLPGGAAIGQRPPAQCRRAIQAWRRGRKQLRRCRGPRRFLAYSVSDGAWREKARVAPMLVLQSPLLSKSVRYGHLAPQCSMIPGCVTLSPRTLSCEASRPAHPEGVARSELLL